MSQFLREELQRDPMANDSYASKFLWLALSTPGIFFFPAQSKRE
jgi:hypothetical protein